MSPDGADVLMPPPRAESNGLGLAGFICSLVGLCSGGVLSPIGLILSLVALKDRPRGFAIAGVVLGALGSCGILLTVILFFVAPIALLGAIGAAGAAGIFPQLDARWEMAQINSEVIAYRDRTGALPLKLDDLHINKTDLESDPWGHPYVYTLGPNGMTYEIMSLGPDGQQGTPDDIVADNDFKATSNP